MQHPTHFKMVWEYNLSSPWIFTDATHTGFCFSWEGEGGKDEQKKASVSLEVSMKVHFCIGPAGDKAGTGADWLPAQPAQLPQAPPGQACLSASGSPSRGGLQRLPAMGLPPSPSAQNCCYLSTWKCSAAPPQASIFTSEAGLCSGADAGWVTVPCPPLAG